MSNFPVYGWMGVDDGRLGMIERAAGMDGWMWWHLPTHLLGPGRNHVNRVSDEEDVGHVLQEGRQVQVHNVLGHVLRDGIRVCMSID